MLDIKFIRDNPDLVKEALKDKNSDVDIEALLSLDEKRRAFIKEIDVLRNSQNKANDEISLLLKNKQKPQDKIEEVKKLSLKIKSLEEEFKKIKAEFYRGLLEIPNMPHFSIPKGGASESKTVRSWGDIKKFDFRPLTHIDLASALDIIDFKRGAKIAGSNFILFKNQGALLERALINFMLDLHTQKHGYIEVFPPFLSNRASMTGTGQLPKMESDMYKVGGEDLFLIPTAEVPVTNIYRDEVIEESDLPVCYTAYTACFRKEAGSYGKDTRGLMRVHQFNKIELVKFVRPENSYSELEKLVSDAEEVLQLLALPYRVALLASGDISFASAKCYDLEVFAPGIDRWLEVSSCSNFEDFQARRANIKFRRKARDGKSATEYVHTLNGSGVALARTVIAILENYQNPDGTVIIPEVLRKYMYGRKSISPRQ